MAAAAGPPRRAADASLVLATAVLGLVFLWRLPLIASAAGYLVPAAVGVVACAAAATVRTLAGRPDGPVLAATAAAAAFIGQVLNTVAGLPAAEELRRGFGWAGAAALVCEVVVAVLVVRHRGRAGASAAAAAPRPLR